MSYELSVEKTAIVNGVSNSCKWLVEDYTNGNVLDYGFGKLRNTKYILEKNINLSILDTEEQINNNMEYIKEINIDKVYKSSEAIKENYYNYILLSFVLNVVPSYEDREFILSNIYNGLTDEGFVYIEVRNDKFLKSTTTKIEYNDGYLLGNGKKKTFQKPYDVEDITNFVKKHKLNVVGLKKTSGSIILKCKK